MTKRDDEVLRLLSDSGLALAPAHIQYNLDTRRDVEIPESTLHRRLNKLEAGGVIEKEDPKGGKYSVTEFGERYLDDDLDEDEKKELEDELLGD